MDAKEFMGRRLRVEFARVKTDSRDRDRGFSSRASNDRSNNRIIVSGFQAELSWQDLKVRSRGSGEVTSENWCIDL